MLLFAIIIQVAPAYASMPCKQIITTAMGDICLYKSDEQGKIDAYTSTYLSYIMNKFDPKKYPFKGRKYSNMRLYNIYRFTINKDGSITDITPVVLEGTEYDDYVKSLIIENPPVPLIEGMPNQLKIELEVVQGVSSEGYGGTGFLWGEYYNIYFKKGKYF